MVSDNIAIIGGGITGLVAAYRLSQRGYKVTLFEKHKYLGGLASGIRLHGSYIERAYHHIFRGDDKLIKLLDEVGLSDRIKWYESSQGMISAHKLYNFTTPLDVLKFAPLPFSPRLQFILISATLGVKKNWSSLEKISASEWLKQHSCSKLYRLIWEPLLKAKFHEEFANVSMAWFWARIYSRARSRDRLKFTEKLGYLEGSLQTLVDKLQTISDKLEVRRDVAVDALISGNKVVLSTDKGHYEFDRVIATVSNSIFAQMIEGSHGVDQYMSRLRNTKYLGAVTLLFSTRQDLRLPYWTTVSDDDIPFSVVIQHTRLIELDSYDGFHVYYLGGYFPHKHESFKMDEDSLMDKWLKSLKKLIPDFALTEIATKQIFRAMYAQHVVTVGYEPVSIRTSMPNVYLANFTQVYPWDRGISEAVTLGEKVSSFIYESICQ